jgi:two-component system, NarL family, nitrate/nitrite response regulator NarL
MPSKSDKPLIRILLADDHPIVREGIRSCLAGYRHLKIVGEAANGEEAVSRSVELKPDIVLMDINMPKMNGIDATREIVKSGVKSRVVILTVVNSQQYVAEMIRCGAKGYVLKDAHPDELVEAIEEVHGGLLYFLVKENIPNPPPPDIPPADPKGILSGREIQVLKLVAEGKSSKEIALGFDVGVRTVKTYRERIMRKIGLHSVAEMTKYAIETGLLRSDSAPPSHDESVSISVPPRKRKKPSTGTS